MGGKKIWLALLLLTLSLSIAYAGDLSRAGLKGVRLGKYHQFVIGTVTKVGEGMVNLELGEGMQRDFAIKAAEKERIRKVKPGDRVLLELDNGNQIIDIVDVSEMHQLVRGQVIGIDKAHKVVALKLKNGNLQNYRMRDAVATKMNDIKIGTAVTLMVDKDNNFAMDVAVD